MATFRAVADAPRGINEIDLFAPYATGLIAGNFFARFLKSADVVNGPFYTWPYYSGTNSSYPEGKIRGNAFQFAYPTKSSAVFASLIGYNDFDITFTSKGFPTNATGIIRIVQSGLLVQNEYVDWWTLYDFELNANEITKIGLKFLTDIAIDGPKTAKANAISSLLNIYQNIRNNNDEAYLTNQNDIFYTFKGDDIIDARRGADGIHPGRGLDKIWCGADQTGKPDGDRDQIYLMDTPPAGVATQPADFLTDNKDEIYQFGREDWIMISSKALNLGIAFSNKKKSKLKPPRRAGSEMIWYEEDNNSQFTDKTRFTYNALTGSLKFDTDGSANGINNAVEIATLYTGDANSAHPGFSTANPLQLYFIL